MAAKETEPITTHNTMNFYKQLKASNQTSYEHDTELMQWYLAGFRGTWFGFYRGFYHDHKKPESTCLSSDVEGDMQEIMQFLAYGQLSDIFKVADSMTNLYYDNKMGCGYHEIYETVKATCASEDISCLSPGMYINNLFIDNSIETIAAFSSVAQEWK